MSDAIVIIPTYNEIENIEAIIKAVFYQKNSYHILVVDDSSPDGTANAVKKLKEEFPDRLFLLERKDKSGLGTAYIDGFKWCLGREYDFIFEMDADFSHNPNDLNKLYDVCKSGNADVAVGSRYVKGVNVVNWPMSRILLSYGASKYVRLITRMKLH
ncbi:MAG: glycosyltransferase, partial [Bacteroidia bacterium]|nr:glycosyltransferase [Bacteroidia bacterium]